VNVTRVTAVAQIGLSVLFLLGYFGALVLFLFGEVHVAPVWRDQLGVMLGVLTAGVMSILGFWFSRNRPSTPPGEEPPKP